MNRFFERANNFFSQMFIRVRQMLPEKCLGKYSAASVFSCFGIVICTIAIIFFSCRSCNRDEYDFRSCSDAISCYKDYLKRLREIKTTDGKRMCDDINKWVQMRDTVYNYIAQHDTTADIHGNTYSQYYAITDSIRYALISLTETWKCSYSDIILVKEGTTPFRNDSDIVIAVQNAVPFFHDLDQRVLTSTTREKALSDYRTFLAIVERNGIHSKNDMLAFIEEEDIVFRQFLRHLYELDSEHVSDITRSTEHICASIFREAREGHIDAKDALTYMSMRTVRRLLQNSVTCVNDIGKHRMHSKMQANAYLWMIIQPFTSIDAFAITTLTPETRENIKYIADKLPKSALFAKTFEIDQESLAYLLPQQLLKMYILSL